MRTITDKQICFKEVDSFVNIYPCYFACISSQDACTENTHFISELRVYMRISQIG